MTKILTIDGVCIHTLKTNNTKNSAMYGYAGQDTGDGRYVVYAPTVGICTVVKGAMPETVTITGVLMSRAEIRAELLKAFKNNKKLSFMHEVSAINADDVALRLVELEVNENTVDGILNNVSLNTQKNKRTGICLRDINDYFINLTAIGRIVQEYSAQELIDLHNDWENGCNNGNFCEFIVGRNKKALTHRFDAKVNDVLYSDGIHKSKRRAELKTSLKTVCKAVRSSASNTNQLVYINLK